jgi:alanine-glyoxylate transaminase/serine-glyoxylate transaminase/serine-pyruvate transaminase
MAALGRRYGALIVVDGVCSVAGEELRMTEWGVDAALTASQKAIGVPPGLALVVAGPRAMETFRQRSSPVANYYADWTLWLPVMESYEARKPSYFGTPAVNLIWALNVSLGQILAEGMEARFARHRILGRACQAAVAALGLGQVPLEPEFAAHTMTAPRYPAGIGAADLLPSIAKAGAVLAGGLHPEIRAEYFRIGHMGAAKVGDVLATVGAIEQGLAHCGYEFEAGAGVAAAAAASQA